MIRRLDRLGSTEEPGEHFSSRVVAAVRRSTICKLTSLLSWRILTVWQISWDHMSRIAPLEFHVGPKMFIEEPLGLLILKGDYVIFLTAKNEDFLPIQIASIGNRASIRLLCSHLDGQRRIIRKILGNVVVNAVRVSRKKANSGDSIGVNHMEVIRKRAAS